MWVGGGARLGEGVHGWGSMHSVVTFLVTAKGTSFLSKFEGLFWHYRRYIQLPISAGMPEAWNERWQDGAAGGQRVTLLQAAAEVRQGGSTHLVLLNSRLAPRQVLRNVGSRLAHSAC